MDLHPAEETVRVFAECPSDPSSGFLSPCVSEDGDEIAGENEVPTGRKEIGERVHTTPASTTPGTHGVSGVKMSNEK